jgi:hypothetical protein
MAQSSCDFKSFHGPPAQLVLLMGHQGPTGKVSFFRECTGRGDLLPTVFSLEQFLLNILLCGAMHGGLLDGDPANEVYYRPGLTASIPVALSRGSGVGPRWCSQHRRGHRDNANYCLVFFDASFSPAARSIPNCFTDKAAMT